MVVLRSFLATLAITGVAVGCGETGRAVSPPPPRVVDVTVDPSGRPYDVPIERGAKLVHRPLAVVHAPSREVLFLGGEEAPYVKQGEQEPVRLADRAGSNYPLDAVWLVSRRGWRRIVGVVLHERESRIVRWRQLRRVAYGTDAGLGGITTLEWAAQPKSLDNELSRLYEEKLSSGKRLWLAADVDGVPGIDTVLFDNGFGDGGFPSIAGYDASGRRAAIVLWTLVAPWRLAFPQGKPPPQVTLREDALAACLRGHGTVDGGARCRRAR